MTFLNFISASFQTELQLLHPELAKCWDLWVTPSSAVPRGGRCRRQSRPSVCKQRCSLSCQLPTAGLTGGGQMEWDISAAQTETLLPRVLPGILFQRWSAISVNRASCWNLQPGTSTRPDLWPSLCVIKRLNATLNTFHAAAALQRTFYVQRWMSHIRKHLNSLRSRKTLF